MALLFMDSWDHYTTADLLEKWTSSAANAGAAWSIGSSNGRHTSNALRVAMPATPSGSTIINVTRTLPPADATAVMGCAVAPSSLTIVGTLGVPIMVLRDGSSAQVSLRLNNNGTVSVVRGTQNGTVLGTTTAVMATGAFTYVEWKVLVHPSAGTVDVRLNGVSALSLTGQNTRNTAASQWTAIAFGNLEGVTNTYGGSTGQTLDYDDLYVLDGTGPTPWNTFLGDVRVDVRLPTGAGATTGWTPSTGSNWQNVDDAAPNDDTDYNVALTAGLTDTFVVQDAVVTGATIYGVQSNLTMRKTDAGACTIASVVRHGGTDYPGAAIAPGTSYANGQTVYATNPGTAAQWAEADFNAAEFGYTRVT